MLLATPLLLAHHEVGYGHYGRVFFLRFCWISVSWEAFSLRPGEGGGYFIFILHEGLDARDGRRGVECHVQGTLGAAWKVERQGDLCGERTLLNNQK